MTDATDVSNVTCITKWINKKTKPNQKPWSNHKHFLQHAFFWIIDLNTLSVSLKAATSVDIPFLKLYFSVTSMLSVCRCWL